MQLFAIDPGPEQSAWVVLTPDGQIAAHGKEENGAVRIHLAAYLERSVDQMAIEMIASYGKPVGAEVFATCLWIGRFAELAIAHSVFASLPLRKDICAMLCGSAHGVSDAVIRQRLIDIYGPGKEKAVGTRRHPGPLYGVKRDVWQALAVGVYALAQCASDTL